MVELYFVSSLKVSQFLLCENRMEKQGTDIFLMAPHFSSHCFSYLSFILGQHLSLFWISLIAQAMTLKRAGKSGSLYILKIGKSDL